MPFPCFPICIALLKVEADQPLAFVPFGDSDTARVGDWVLTHLGSAREVISSDEAEKITAALAGLRAVMEGEDLGDAFADLEANEPQLPPHLRAAFEAGQSTG